MATPPEVTSASRLASLRLSRLLDTAAEEKFDKITELASDLLNAPVSLLSLVDADRQFFKSHVGLPEPYATVRQTPLSHSFCQYVAGSGEPLIVGDAREHLLLKDNLAIPDLGVIAYLGVPVRAPDGAVLGSLCAIDDEPRHWSDTEVRIMNKLADLAEEHIALRIRTRDAEELAVEKDVLAREYHHRVKNTLAVSAALVKLTARHVSSAAELVEELSPRLVALGKAHDALMMESGNADLGEIVQRLLQPYCLPGAAVNAAGPPVPLSGIQVTPLCLVVHELATNSVKYGAFRDRSAVTVRWEVSANDQIKLVWVEALREHPKNRSGFGTKLMDVAARQLGGTLQIDFSSNKLTADLTFPKARKGQPADA